MRQRYEIRVKEVKIKKDANMVIRVENIFLVRINSSPYIGIIVTLI